MRKPSTTHGVRRREQARKALREQLRAWRYIRLLYGIAEKAKEAKPADIPALQLQATIYHRLLNKVLPDLKAIEHSGFIDHRDVSELSDGDLEDIASGRGEGASEAPGSAEEPPAVH